MTKVVLVWWQDPGDGPDEESHQVFKARYNAAFDDEEAWFDTAEFEDVYLRLANIECSHWMPLPGQPKKK